MPQFVLKAHDIDVDGRSYDLPIPNVWLHSVLAGTDLDARVDGDAGRAVLHAQRQGDEILVTGTITSTIVAQCVRCLEDAKLAVRADIGSLFSPTSTREQADEDTPEDVTRERYSGDDIVLDDLVREQLILEVPMQPLCREDCPGIEVPEHVRPPADFGAEAGDDVDPRLAPLKNISVSKPERGAPAEGGGGDPVITEEE